MNIAVTAMPIVAHKRLADEELVDVMIQSSVSEVIELEGVTITIAKNMNMGTIVAIQPAFGESALLYPFEPHRAFCYKQE